MSYELDPELATVMAALAEQAHEPAPARGDWKACGGMVLGTLDLYDELISWYVTQAGVAFLSVGYRRAPDEGTGTTLSEDVFAGLAHWHMKISHKLRLISARAGTAWSRGGAALRLAGPPGRLR